MNDHVRCQNWTISKVWSHVITVSDIALVVIAYLLRIETACRRGVVCIATTKGRGAKELSTFLQIWSTGTLYQANCVGNCWKLNSSQFAKFSITILVRQKYGIEKDNPDSCDCIGRADQFWYNFKYVQWAGDFYSRLFTFQNTTTVPHSTAPHLL